MISMRLVIALGASLLSATALVTPGGAQTITPAQLESQVAAACAISVQACQSALDQAMLIAAGFSAADQSTFGVLLAQLAISDPNVAPLVADALADSGNPILVASYNATNGDQLSDVTLAAASPA